MVINMLLLCKVHVKERYGKKGFRTGVAIE